ncbi:MAG TPA: hypothetical protein VF928_16340 [Usitatibacteraceae bacterium]
MALQTAAPSKPGSMFFSDARTCKEWLKSIPVTNVPQAQQIVLDALRMFNRAGDIVPVERLTCMELMRDKTAFLLSEQRARYAGKTIPLTSTDYAAWNVSRNLIGEMEAGYRRCWQDVAGAAAELADHAALVIQRIIRYIGLQMLMAGFIYRRFDPALWMRLHLQWLEAESRGLTVKRVKDSVGAIDGNSSVLQAYTAVLFGQLGCTHELMPRQIDFVDAVLKRFGHKVTVSRDIPRARPTGASGQVYAVDLLANAGAGFHPVTALNEHTRVLDVSELSRSLRRRIKKLTEGEEPGSMDLPADWGTHEACGQLLRLHHLWCEGGTARIAATVPEEQDAILAFGISETHFILSGNMFEQPGVTRELTRQELNDISMFGKVSEATIRARYADFNYGTETWRIIDESRGAFRMMRPANSPRGVGIGKLIGMKVGKQGAFYLGVIREIIEESEGNIAVTIAMLPGKPEATAVRASDAAAVRSNATYTQGFRLPPMDALKIPETLIVPSGLAQKGRGIDIYHPDHGSPKEVKLIDFIERGADFDRVTIA